MDRIRTSHSLELPADLWRRLERLQQHREGVSLDAAPALAVDAGYAVLANEDDPSSRRGAPIN